jgi:hypothetical protein
MEAEPAEPTQTCSAVSAQPTNVVPTNPEGTG